MKFFFYISISKWQRKKLLDFYPNAMWVVQVFKINLLIKMQFKLQSYNKLPLTKSRHYRDFKNTPLFLKKICLASPKKWCLGIFTEILFLKPCRDPILSYEKIFNPEFKTVYKTNLKMWIVWEKSIIVQKYKRLYIA